MDGVGFQLSLLLLLSLWAPVPAYTLEGSCVEAGFTECCDLSVDGPCFAPPTYCLCDPSCREHGDCCEDIDEICTPDHPEPVPPILLLALDATYHTATLLWGLPPDAKATTNQTYTVIYWDPEDPNTTYSHNVSKEMESGQALRLTVTGLRPGMLYQWAVEASTETMSSLSVVSNFSTMTVAKLEWLSVRVYNTSSVIVTWATPRVPLGVRVQAYTVHYRTLDSSEDHLSSGYVTTWESSAVVNGLRSHSSYHFWVQAVVVEATVQSNIISSEQVTVFLPDSTIVQLRGGPFKPCSDWTESTDVEVMAAFRGAIYRAVYSDISHQRELIERDFVVCENSSSDESQGVYRASVYSSPHHTTDAIRHLLEQQVLTGELSGLLVDKTCPVNLERTSEPLCRTTTQPQDSDKECQKPPDADTTIVASSFTTTTTTSNCSSVVTVPLLVAALLVELFLVVFVCLLVTTVVMVVRRRRYLEEKSSHPSIAQPNEYS